METGNDFKFFCDDELSISTEEGAFGKYVVLTSWEETKDNKRVNGDEFMFSSAEAREFADWLRRYADKIDNIKQP